MFVVLLVTFPIGTHADACFHAARSMSSSSCAMPSGLRPANRHEKCMAVGQNRVPQTPYYYHYYYLLVKETINLKKCGLI